MPRSTREWAQRKLDAANNSLNWFDKHILEVADKYCDEHIEIAGPLTDIAVASDMLKACVGQVRDMI